MKDGTQDEYIKNAGGVSAFSTINTAGDLAILCSMYTTSGKINSSIECRETLIERFKDNSDTATHYSVVASYDSLVLFYYNLGRYDDAARIVDEGIALLEDRELYDNYVYGSSLKSLRITLHAYQELIAHKRGDKKTEKIARAYVEQSKPWLSKQTKVTKRITGFTLSRIYLALEKYELAAEYAKYARDVIDTEPSSDLGSLFDFIGPSEEEINKEYELAFDTSLYFFGRADLEAKRYHKALAHYKEFEKYTSVSKDYNLHWMYWYDYARTYLGLENKEQAIVMLKKAINIIESQRTDFNSEMGKLGFARGKQQPYELMVTVLLDMGYVQQAFTYVERAKARALVDLLAGREDVSLTKSHKENQYLSQLQQVESQVRNPHAEKEETEDAKRGLIRVKTNSLKVKYPELASLVSVDTLTSSEINSLLKNNEVLVEYYIADDSLFAFVLENGKLKAYPLKDGKKLVSNIRKYRESLMSARGRWQTPSMTLYKQLIKPFERQLRNKKVVIVPHGAMHYLPFASLYDGSTFLVDKAQIRLMPSASVMQYLGQHEQITDHMIILGNPDLNNREMDLPGAEREAKVIAKLWSDTDVKLRAEATETALKNNISNYGMFHFASHGVFEPENPLESGLLLASDNKNDGRLTVAEIYGIKINADLVTLSACETGLGDIVNGDDVVGLNRGFLYAGADSILSSLWSVEDKPTAYFMQSFYAYLKNNNKAKALQLAQIKTRKRYGHPYRWASFQLIGATD